MPRIPDVSKKLIELLELVRERVHLFRDALAVHLPDWAPHLALIEMPGEVDYVPVPRRQVTDLLEFPRTEEVRSVDEMQLDLLTWREVVRLDDPPMTTRIMNPERKMVSRPVQDPDRAKALGWPRTSPTSSRRTSISSVFLLGLDNNL